MECTWDGSLLKLVDSRQLPVEVRQIIEQKACASQYLETISHVAQDARYTDLIFAHCEKFFAHVCASSGITTLARVVPFAKYLEPYAVHSLLHSNLPASEDYEGLSKHLLAVLRLLATDGRTFKSYVSLAGMQALLRHPSRPVVYLAIRILQVLLDAADCWFESMVERYLGEDTPDSHIDGPWDAQIIDYRFLSLWEDQRREKMTKLLRDAREEASRSWSTSVGIIEESAFDLSTALVGGMLLPRSLTDFSHPQSFDSIVPTATTKSNIEKIVSELRDSRPLLLSGLAGSGKSLLVRHLAHRLGKLDTMVTLHLNEQSDAKLLTGVHTSGDDPGTFVWRPGVLTTAVQEGRWVLIEDLDRAPQEIIGTLLPLIESGELFIPSQKQHISAAQGFRILATVRSTLNHRGEATKPLTHMLGARLWHSVSVQMPGVDEQKQIIQQLFPSLSELLPQFMAVHERLQASRERAVLVGQSKTGVMRAISPRDLLKWCHRVNRLLQPQKPFSSNDVDDIFMEAVDCFVGALPDGPAREGMVAVIAEELRIDPQRRDYLQSERDVHYEVDRARISVGRYSLPRAKQQQKVSRSSFSTNPHTSRMLERVAAAVTNRESLLLVGETGVGKTTAVQHLAKHLGKRLEPFNLSQQSEVGDLLGGFKPVTARSLIVPMTDEFDELFRSSFSITKNQQFLELLSKQMAKSNWKGVCKLWQQALKMVDQQRSPSASRHGEAPNKKRKVETKKTPDFARWDDFAAKAVDVERRVSAGTEGFAFSFVEGNIVKAVRNGDWVLLDEINLASPDTLESIADLLDPAAPSLLLTEAGNIERIEAHSDFRVFAAMNPATDVGKKDLPPGIRSRFTELYVESPDKDIKSLQSIVRSYLRVEAAADQAVALDVSRLYQKVIGLAIENKLVDGAGQKPHFSLRTLTRTLTFAKYIAPQCSIRRALYEGFQMSFLTFLDRESERLVQPLLEQHLFGKRTNVRAELQKALRKPEDEHEHVQGWPGSKHWVRRGQEELQDQPHYILTSFIRSNLENLVRAASTRRFPVLIQGPTSSGKTSMIEYLAKRTGHNFVRINNHEHTDLQEYLGTYVSGTDGRLQFQEGILVKALREGHWIVLDELNLAPTDVLEALNRLLDDNRELLVPETQETVRPHENFMLFATQNPAGLYGGRKTLSRAFRNRFLELHFDDIPVDELQEILHRRTQLPESRCKRIVEVYRELSVMRQESRIFEQKSFATLRDLFRWALRTNDTIDQLAANGFMLLAERVRKPEERDALKAIIEKVMGRNGPRGLIDEAALYGDANPEIQAYVANSPERSVVWTKAMRRLYVLVSRAIQNNEPILLVGETGCGKTTVCQMLAHALRQTLHIVNAHQNTETGDLIGSQRPIRNRAAIETSLRQKLVDSPLLQSLQTATSHSTDGLLDAYDQAVASLPVNIKQEHYCSQSHINVQSDRIRYKALFEWVDGSLVQAMKDGAFFLLDEISLADDSVLERINSVLESQRSVLLAEKGSLDAYVTAAPGFEFLATMNPGGDYGKRELSPALRNRFTEIWVPALSDSEDIVQIVTSKLNASTKPYASAIVSFAQWFKARYNTSATSSISVRDALAWAQFTNTFANVDTVAAVVHGAALVYIDTLGANPAGLMTLTGRGLDDERRACLAELSRLISADASASYFASANVTKDERFLHVGPFSISNRTGSSTLPHAFTFDARTTRNNAMRVVRAMQLSKPVMLEGSPGVGKTALITAIASAAGAPLTRINLSEQTDLLDLFGSDAPVEGAATGIFAWRDAPFLRAMKNGEWVLLDEMNLASQSVLEGLNACLDHRGEVYVPELGQAFSKHPDFRLFAAQNPHHQGGGRKGLPASFVNRFTVVYADAFRPDDLMLICQRSFPQIDAKTLNQVIAFVDGLDTEVVHRRRFGANGGPWEFNLRDISRWLILLSSEAGLLKAGNARDFVHLLFVQRFRSPPDRAFVADLFTNLFPDTPPAADLYRNVSSSTLQLGLALLPRHEFKAHSLDILFSICSSATHLRAMESMMLCVQQRWPVILTGPSGSGKTSLLRLLAATTGASVATISMNAETDAMDLIGGYEQADPLRQGLRALDEVKAALALALKTDLLQDATSSVTELLDGMTQGSLPTAGTLGRLAAAVGSLHSPQMQDSLDTLSRCSTAVEKARFEWTDGVLVDALVEGKWLILDNANLCSSSVLDRLNSLLEPSGTLIMSEHTKEDGSPRLIQPHPDFRVFLITDPRYGELSRAMRNRAVEIYLSHNDANVTTTSVHTESSMARFAQLKSLRPSDDHQLATEATNHLGLVDHALSIRLRRQLGDGLFDGARLADDSWATPLVQPLQGFYSKAASRAHASADYACVQTFHPLNNQALVQQNQQTFAEASTLAFLYDVSARLTPLVQQISSLGSNQSVMRHLDRVERAQLAKRGTKGSALLTQVGNMIQTTSQWAAQLECSPELSTIRSFFHCFAAYLSHILEATASHQLDVALLNAWLSAVRDLQSGTPAKESALKTLVTPLRQSMTTLESPQHSSTGRACIAMWQKFKPQTPGTMSALQALLKLERLVHQFDGLSGEFAQSVPLLASLRSALARSLAAAPQGANNIDALTQRLEDIMPNADRSSDEEPAVPPPHFVNASKALYRRFAMLRLEGNSLPLDQLSTIGLLARRSIASDTVGIQAIREGSNSPCDLQMLASALPQPTTDGSEDPPLSSDGALFQSCKSANDVSLARLELLMSESQTLARIVCQKAHLLASNPLAALDSCLRRLLHGLLEALSSAAGSDAGLGALAAEMVMKLTGRETFRSPAESVAAGRPGKSIMIVRGQLCEVIDYLLRPQGEGPAQPKMVARVWASFAAACLALFVPGTAFDPALKPRLVRDMHRDTLAHLGSELQAVQALRVDICGESESLRARTLQQDIMDLGAEPEVEEVCRPVTTEITQLQGEFDGLMRAITQGHHSSPVPNEIMMRNLLQARSRLERQYRAYSDVTGPVIGFIDCLRLSHELSLIAELQSQQREMEHSLAKVTPFIDCSLTTWLSDTPFISLLGGTLDQKQTVYVLSLLGARGATKTLVQSSVPLQQHVEESLARFYLQWKAQLSDDQRKEAAKSSLYRFKGDEDLEDDLSNEQIEALFPSQDTGSSQPDTLTQKRERQEHQLAQQLSQLHHVLYTDDEGRSVPWDLLQRYADVAANFGPSLHESTKIPAMIRALSSTNAKISQGKQANELYDMYIDPNVEEATRLRGLMFSLRSRFETLHEAWPEHATPLDVERTCAQILSVAHSEPLTKFLPMLEKLHETVTEWQKIASREHSVNDQLEKLTALIVSWRQLELSSWAGLLHREAVNCEHAASSWWYVAYETIVLASRTVQQSSSELKHHTEGLLRTLEGFMASSGLGEFTPRLEILEDFSAHLATLVVSEPSLEIVRQALTNFLAYHKHFEATVTERLQKTRTSLEKDIKNVIQVASWKDRNIEILKQSAKSSHKKLLRIVRKYRRLLAQPVAPILQGGVPHKEFIQFVHEESTTSLQILDVSASTQETLVHLPSWNSRPDRFKFVDQTVALMRNKTSLIHGIGAGQRISSFVEDINVAINELQKATPSVLTKENEKSVLYLKSRKRRLLADVLRDARSMGFQSNLGDDALKVQMMTHLVLANIPSFASTQVPVDIAAADHSLHRFLSIMPSVREGARKHSEDLTPAEAARCLALLESMLQVSMAQRASLCRHLQTAAEVRIQTQQLAAFATCLAPTSSTSTCGDDMVVRVTCLTMAVDSALDLVRVQGELGNMDYGDTLQSLQTNTETLQQLQRAARNLPTLPANITGEAVESVRRELETATTAAQSSASAAVAAHPELEPVLSHIPSWGGDLSLEPLVIVTNSQATVDTNSWVRGLLQSLDHVLGVTQELEQTVARFNASEHEKKWLVERSKQLMRSLDILRADVLRNEISALLSQLPQLASNSNGTLAALAVACHRVFPILSSFGNAYESLLSELCTMHTENNKMAYNLATSFSTLCQQGFCSPSEKANDETEKSGDVEAGTGLGEGEGGEDISKDVGDDEDLSELAQEAGGKSKDEEMEDQQDAVDMADQEMEGELGDGPEGDKEEDGDGSDDGGADGEMDEEAGEVDDLGPATVDEKMWDQGVNENPAEKDVDEAQGTADEQEMAAGKDNKGDDAESSGDNDERAGPPDAERPADEAEEVEQQKPEGVDQHVDEQKNLDLPEDINMDGQNTAEEGSDLESLADMNDDADGGAPDDTGEIEDDERPDGQRDEAQNMEDNVDADEEDAAAQQGEPAEEYDESAEAQSDILMEENPEEADQDLQEEDVSGEAGNGADRESANQRQAKASASAEHQDDVEQDSEQQQEADAGASGKQQGTQSNDTNTGAEQNAEEQSSLPYKQIGDVLEEWYRQHRQIEQASQRHEAEQGPEKDNDMNMADATFEHLPDDQAAADTQALGAANAEQSTALDEAKGMPVNDQSETESPTYKDAEEPETIEDYSKEDPEPMEPSDALQAQDRPNAFVGETRGTDTDVEMADEEVAPDEDHVNQVDQQLSDTHLDLQEAESDIMSLEEARSSWSEHEASTRNLALVLTEHLRLILQPTQATKMRGDFRTGKRLNIKRIISYIASSYKRDKIWMRRSVPSKRSYQIMLAIDDSKSMAESESRGLAFETLALVSKAMSMLEVGELSVVSFGEDVKVAHDFSTPFTSEAGAKVFRHFSFAQRRTNVRKLLAESIELFRQARLKAASSASELWQLQLIISDGVCEDHPAIRQLVRQAHEERIMVIFVVVDAANQQAQANDGPKQSILDLQTAEFVKNATGEMEVKMLKYLDTFPFNYYLIVRDVQELPGVLAGALRQWFAEVVESG